jgi:para-aminobenzoate synthetase component 1
MSWIAGKPLLLQSPRLRLIADAAGARLTDGERLAEAWDDPLDALHWLERSARESGAADDGWVGYLGYDLGRRFEALPTPRTQGPAVPLLAFGRVSQDAPREAARAKARSSGVRSNFGRRAYLDAVERALEYIRAGDIFQVNLAQTLSTATALPAGEVFERLQRNTPADYAALLDFGAFAIVSNSPELFFRVEPMADGRRRIVNRPIKGTRPRLPGMEQELLRSEKDRAELTMIVDLQRNDLGRICEIGSVKVTEPRVIETHPTVYHGVATVEGVLRPDVGFVDILRAIFPCGSITGCPKIRAMQIIDELEPTRRGPYCGAIGRLGRDGAMEFNVAIRTMTFADGMVQIPVGGGIVADSEPATEYEETLVKARAMLAALGLNERDLDRD